MQKTTSMVTVLLWTLFLVGADGYGLGGRGFCTIRGVHVPIGVVQTFGTCEYCLCQPGGTHICDTFASVNCDGFDTNCEKPYIPFGECCPRCHSADEPEWPTYSGYGNNVANPMQASVGTQLIRLSPPRYGDGFSTPRELGTNGNPLTNVRTISNALGDVDNDPENTNEIDGPEEPRGLTCLVWQWGQFIDHDFTLVTEVPDTVAEEFNIGIDAALDPLTTNGGLDSIHFARADWDRNSGTGPTNWRGHRNSISPTLDASNVYGSDAYSNYLLRGGDQRTGGLLRVHTSQDAEGDDLLPLNSGDGGVGLNLANMGGDVFAMGDFRGNEQLLLTSMHTIWVRHHNKLATALAAANPSWNDERIFQEARKRVMAHQQQITYDEWLPAILGVTLPPYSGYQPNIPVTVSTEFIGAFFRFGHTMIRDNYAHVASDGTTTGFTLRDLFFDNSPLVSGTNSVNGFLRGLAQCKAQAIDVTIVEALRNFLFDGHNDLLSLNLQRGRDLGLGGFNDIRVALGLARHDTWSDLTDDTNLQTKLASVYADVDECDAFICAMAEKKMYGSAGETLGVVLTDQFARLRDGDRFYWEHWLSEAEKNEVRGFRIIDLYKQNGVVSDPDTRYSSHPNFQSLFFAQGNEYFESNNLNNYQCTDMTPTDCEGDRSTSTSLTWYSYPDSDTVCVTPQPCLCDRCDPNEEAAAPDNEKICGSDGQKYNNDCELRAARCEKPNLREMYRGKNCYNQKTTLEFRFGDSAHDYVEKMVQGGPPRLNIHVDDISGNGQKWEVHYVTECDSKARLNPDCSPEAPIPPAEILTAEDCGNGDCLLTGRLFSGRDVFDTLELNYLQTQECKAEANDLGSLIGRALFVKPEGAADDSPHGDCRVLTGSPFVEITANLKTGAPGSGGRDSVAKLYISQSVDGLGASTVTVRVKNDFVDTLLGGKYSVWLSDSPCTENNWEHYAYGHNLNGETPPVISFAVTSDLGSENTFLGVNPYLSVMGARSPVFTWARLVNHLDSSVLACGNVDVIKGDASECLVDNTANGGIGRSFYREFKESDVFAINLAENDEQSQGDTTTNASNQVAAVSGVAGNGVFLIMGALIIVLLIGLIFVVIVLYVRSNPYTAPSALKKVGSLAGDPRPSAQVVN